MSTLYSWRTLYGVNIAALDADHKKLFALIQKLSAAMDNNGVVADILNELTTYTKSHFAAEEALMKRHGFPGLAAHKAEHDKLTEKVSVFARDFAAGKVCVSGTLLLFLSGWLSNHILKIDKQYSKFLNEKGVY